MRAQLARGNWSGGARGFPLAVSQRKSAPVRSESVVPFANPLRSIDIDNDAPTSLTLLVSGSAGDGRAKTANPRDR